ncbi:hypothetical protein JCM12298_26630 [Desulfothermus naphthae]
MDKVKDICIIPTQKGPSEIETSIKTLNAPLSELLGYINLPTENVLSPISERRKVIHALESTLEILPIAQRKKAYYLSKFTVAITVGLFDGALAYLWDETIKAIKNIIVSFDLQYFFTVAESLCGRYRNLHTKEDLDIISEHDLLEISRRIGLINDVNFKRLEHVNYLRNHASSAHPNENDISGIEMLSLLEHCLKYAITARPDHSVIQIKRLLNNIRTNEIPDEDFYIIGQDISKQPQERINDFILSIFGMYCDPRQEPIVKRNIEKLAPYIWKITSEEIKYQIGSKFGLYRKNGDVDRKDATHRFLEIVNGLKYKDEDSLAAELLEKLQNLRSVHFDWYNFYNEYPHAKSIEESIPRSGIPESVRKIFVKVICICYCGNGRGYREGVDERAVPYYKKYIDMFSINEIKEYLKLFQDREFVFDLDMPKADRRMRELAKLLKSKTTDIHINKLLDLIINFPQQKLPNLSEDKRYKETISFI